MASAVAVDFSRVRQQAVDAHHDLPQVGLLVGLQETVLPQDFRALLASVRSSIPSESVSLT